MVGFCIGHIFDIGHKTFAADPKFRDLQLLSCLSIAEQNKGRVDFVIILTHLIVCRRGGVILLPMAPLWNQ